MRSSTKLNNIVFTMESYHLKVFYFVQISLWFYKWVLYLKLA